MAFDFYFAGSQAPETDDLIKELNANRLLSYVNDRKTINCYIQYKKDGWTGKLMIDNGAFTVHRKGGKINIDEYINWINSNDQYVDYFIALDDIPGKWGQQRTLQDTQTAVVNTWNNFCYMVEKVNHPEKLIPVFHQYESYDQLKKFLTSDLLKSHYMCLSANKELTNTQREEWYSKCYAIINRLNPSIKVHCLGSATLQNAEKYPFTSMDATSWIMTGANGNILTEKGVIYVGDKKTFTEQERESLEKLLSKYNFTVEQVQQNYKIRMLVNIHYLYEQSQTLEFKNIKAVKRKLF